MLDKLFGNSGRELQTLLQNTLKLVRKADLRSPMENRLIYSGVLHGLLFLSLVMMFHQWHLVQGIGIFAVVIFILSPYGFLFHLRMRAQMIYLTYACITQKTSTEAAAKEQIAKISWSLRLLAFLEFLIATKSGDDSENKSILGFIAQILLSVVSVAFDVAENFLLPAMVIEGVSVQDAVPSLQKLKDNIPASLMGAFGVDLIGQMASGASFLVYPIVLAMGAGASVWASSHVAPEHLTLVRGHQVYIIPFIFSGFLCSYIWRSLRMATTSLKAVYFAVFYTSLNHPMEISETYKEATVSFLNFGNVVLAPSSAQKSIYATSGGPSRTQASITLTSGLELDPELFQLMLGEISQLMKSGKTAAEIKTSLVAKGYPEHTVEMGLASHKAG